MPETRLQAATLALAALLLTLASCSRTPPWQDPAAPLENRIDALLAEMTLEEKVSQLVSDSAPIERLGIPRYNWWNECLHGVARAGRATVFPQAIGLAATFDQELMYRVATVISDEGRAKHHEFVRRGKQGIYQGLTFWTPNINIFRDPRWGRGMETYGEDPYLSGRMAVAFVKGIQGDDPKYLKAIATVKHYAVHSGPESDRHTFDATVDERDLRETYLPQFEMAVVEAEVQSAMCAYNRFRGEAACASPALLDEILRREWGFRGYVVSDCGAIQDIDRNHKVADTPEQASAMAVKAGTDLNCGVQYLNLADAVRQGLIREEEIDMAVRRLLEARFRLGMFDPPEMVPYAQIPYERNDSAENAEVALEAARKSVVLLKNDKGTLPFRKGLGKIAVIGPHADDVEVMLGNYNGKPSAPVTVLEATRKKVSSETEVVYARGSEIAVNLPYFESVPSTALFVEEGGENGLKGEYFASCNFNGELHRPRELGYPTTGEMVGEAPENPQPVMTRVDSQIEFDWRDGSPGEGLPDDDFGVRWTGYIEPPVTGTYKIGGYGFNAYDLYLDGERIVRFHNVHHPSYQYAEVDLEAGRLYPVKIEFFEFINDASMRFVWSVPGQNTDYVGEALEAAKSADAVIMVMGLSPRLEGEEMRVPVEGFEGGDRLTLDLPKVQEELIAAVAKLKKPTALVLMNGSAVAVVSASREVPALVEAWYPGQAGGTAVADVLFGDYNPAGRLPVTFYSSVKQLPLFEDYGMAGRTYRYFKGTPLYPFGYGLSYTTFGYKNLNVPASAARGEDVPVSVEVENTGDSAGEEVVQVYVANARTNTRAPVRSLAGFRRIALEPGEKQTVEFTIASRAFSLINAAGERVIEPGQFVISVGGEQPGFRGPQDARTTETVEARLRME